MYFFQRIIRKATSGPWCVGGCHFDKVVPFISPILKGEKPGGEQCLNVLCIINPSDTLDGYSFIQPGLLFPFLEIIIQMITLFSPFWFSSLTIFHYKANSEVGEDDRDSTCFQKIPDEA